jgi:hypothetical protein
LSLDRIRATHHPAANTPPYTSDVIDTPPSQYYDVTPIRQTRSSPPNHNACTILARIRGFPLPSTI